MSVPVGSSVSNGSVGITDDCGEIVGVVMGLDDGVLVSGTPVGSAVSDCCVGTTEVKDVGV